jgi:hypothetical protein
LLTHNDSCIAIVRQRAIDVARKVDRRLERCPFGGTFGLVRLDALPHLVVQRLGGRNEQHASVGVGARDLDGAGAFPSADAAEEQREIERVGWRGSHDGSVDAHDHARKADLRGDPGR